MAKKQNTQNVQKLETVKDVEMEVTQHDETTGGVFFAGLTHAETYVKLSKIEELIQEDTTFSFVDEDMVNGVESMGYVVCDRNCTNTINDKFACQITETGLEFMKAQEQANSKPIPEETKMENTTAINLGFQIFKIDCAAIVERRTADQIFEKYPFNSMEVDSGFFVPCATPEQETSVRNDVASVNRKLIALAKKTETPNEHKAFGFCKEKDGSKYNCPGIKGMLVFRTK